MLFAPRPCALSLKSFVLLGLCWLIGSLPMQAVVVDTDVCVYGGAAGGVTAAVQVARMGKSVSLLVFNNHLGGLSSGGLGQTDVGNNGTAYIQGMAREFYTRIGAKYGSSAAKFTFEPKIAEAVFNEMAAEANVPVFFGRRLLSTTMDGRRIKQITTDNGDVFRARVFLDASYEGDLLKQAGVSYTAGREANAQYGETINGVQRSTSGNQIIAGVDPYVVKGDATSGLLPGVNANNAAAVNGSADSLIQAFCYRLCLTNVAANRILVPQPPGYKEADFELLLRAIEAGQTTGFWKLDTMPNGKTDSNNAGGMSCDFIGGNVGFVEGTYAQREQIAKAHEYWQRGLIWTVQNHPRVPAAVRSTWSVWGLPKDEFLDTDHWPHQLYVREARRMVSDYVMTEKNCRGTVKAADSICLGSYTMDSHNTQRIVVNGQVRNEGDIQSGVSAPYPIAYRALVPKAGECENLLVPWCLSATHIAFGSIRMEPVFMNVGQSAATAACFAIDDEVSVQEVSYAKLKAQLLADNQVLNIPAEDETADIIVDNADSTGVTLTGAWTASTTTTGYYGSNYLNDGNADKGTKSVLFTPTLPAAGSYTVYLRWSALANRATNVPVDVRHTGGTTTASPLINQTANGGVWFSLGTYEFAAGASATAGSVLLRTTGTDGYVIADAVRFVATGQVPVVSLWTTNAQAAEPTGTAARSAKIMLRRTGVTDAALNVSLTIGGSATNGSDYSALPTLVTIPAGASITTLSLTPKADTEAEGLEKAIVSLASSANYAIGTLNQAIVNIADRPFDAWRRSYFTTAQLANSSISGDLADPDGDGLNNLAECFFRRNPLVPSTAAPVTLETVSGSTGAEYLSLTYTQAIQSDLVGVPEVSSDLQQWSSAASAVEQTTLSDDGTVQTRTARDLTPLAGQKSRFLRLRITRSVP